MHSYAVWGVLNTLVYCAAPATVMPIECSSQHNVAVVKYPRKIRMLFVLRSWQLAGWHSWHHSLFAFYYDCWKFVFG